VIDEPFRGTNPALRVPIVVSTLDYLGDRDVAIAATHDLEVAAQVDGRFARGYFREPDDDTGQFDRKLRSGIAPTSNALALLVRAGYPRAIVAAVERRVRGDAATPLVQLTARL
jgi:DNA mismatch repair ATPase MutS